MIWFHWMRLRVRVRVRSFVIIGRHKRQRCERRR